MSEFNVHDSASAPEGGREALQRAKRAFGFTPNLIGVMAEAPALAHAYLDIGKSFAETSLTPKEQQVVLVAVSRENRCDYCVAAHSTVGASVGLSERDLSAIREGRPLPDAKLEALREFATTIIEKRGWVDDESLSAFLSAGFERRQVLEVILGVGMKTLSNYTNHIAHTPLDTVFEPRRWESAA